MHVHFHCAHSIGRRSRCYIYKGFENINDTGIQFLGVDMDINYIVLL